MPVGVPVEVKTTPAGAKCAAAFFGDLTIIFNACRVGPEYEAILLVEVTVDQNRKAIGVLKICVSPTIRDDDAFRIAVVTDDADVKCAIGVTNKNFGFLACCCAFNRALLPESVHGGLTPCGVIDDIAIELGFALKPDRCC